MDRWTEIELFVQVAELGSLSRAAAALGLSNAAASRHLAALETRLAARLVQRNTRRLFLTDVGEAFYRRCKPLLGELREAETAVNEAVLKPAGLLRVQASLSFSMIVIAPLLTEFNARYPDLRIEVVASNRYHDLLESGIDVAIRNREFENDSAITVRRLAETKRVLAASPLYLQRHGTPRTPDELAQHRLLIYNLANQPQPAALHAPRRRDLAAGARRARGQRRPGASAPRRSSTWASCCSRCTSSTRTWSPAAWCRCCRSGNCSA